MKRSGPARPGVALRNFRRQKGLTLSNVSERTGIAIATLSRIENDQVSPTYNQLRLLSEGLSIDIAQLLSSTPTVTRTDAAARMSVNRVGDGEVLETSSQTLTYLSANLINKEFAPILGTIKARSLQEFGEFMTHSGVEFLFVIAGELELHTTEYAPVRLQPGESAYFDSTMPHAYVSVGKQPCRVLSVCTAPHRHELEAMEPVSERTKATSSSSAARTRRTRKLATA